MWKTLACFLVCRVWGEMSCLTRQKLYTTCTNITIHASWKQKVYYAHEFTNWGKLKCHQHSTNAYKQLCGMFSSFSFWALVIFAGFLFSITLTRIKIRALKKSLRRSIMVLYTYFIFLSYCVSCYFFNLFLIAINFTACL